MDDLKVISISDIHIGHPQVPAEVTHANLVKVLYPHLNDDLDILIFGGDFFHTLLDMNGQSGFHAVSIIDEIKFLAWQHKFFVRINRGTFSHDRLQNQFFLKGNEPNMIGGELMVRLFDTITIEHIEAFGIDILYVPDDLPYEDATPVIKDKIADAQLDMVDLAVVHSYFEHVLPPGMPRLPHNTYSADLFGTMVKGVVLHAHIHTPGVFKKVVTNGSFERQNHGEEEAKGFFIIRYNKITGKVIHEFIRNIYATRFDTINLSKYTSEEEGMARYSSWLQNLIEDSCATNPQIHVRVLADDALILDSIVAYTRSTTSNIVISRRKASKNNLSEEEVITEIADLPIITIDNLPDMASEFLLKDKGIEMSAELIKEVLNAPG